MSGKQVSTAYRAASRLEVEILRQIDIGPLKQARVLMTRHARNGHGAWDQPLQLLNEVIKEKEE